MEKGALGFKSFAEADAADVLARRDLTPEQRVEIFLAVQQRGAVTAAEPKLTRVC